MLFTLLHILGWFRNFFGNLKWLVNKKTPQIPKQCSAAKIGARYFMSLFFNEKWHQYRFWKLWTCRNGENSYSMFVKCHFVPSTACGANLAKFGHLRFGHEQLFSKNTACLELNRGYKMPVYSWSTIILSLVYYQSFPNLYSNPFYIKN